MKKYHYEYFAYTADNLRYGRMLLGKSRNSSEAYRMGLRADKGCFVIEKHRVVNKEKEAQ